MNKVIAMSSNYMQYIEEWKNTNMDAIWAANEWKLEHMYKAILSLSDTSHPCGKANNPWWASRGYHFPKVGEGADDGEWADEYMYKRTHRPQEDAFMQK